MEEHVESPNLKPVSLPRFRWGLLSIPPVLCIVLFKLSTMDFQGWSDYSKFKDLMEIAHPAVLFSFTVLMCVRFSRTRNYLSGWLLALGLSLFLRELHFWGTGTAIYIALAALFYFGAQHKKELIELTNNRNAISLFAMVFVCYFFSQFIDRGIAKRLIRVILWDFSWELPHSSNLEEFLEFLGGTFLLLTPVFLRPKRNQETE